MPLLQEYNQFQVKQLTKLIEVTRTDLKKEDRQKVMNMITIDAHSRDMVESIAESGIDRCTLAPYAPLMYGIQICYLPHHCTTLPRIASARYALARLPGSKLCSCANLTPYRSHCTLRQKLHDHAMAIYRR